VLLPGGGFVAVCCWLLLQCCPSAGPAKPSDAEPMLAQQPSRNLLRGPDRWNESRFQIILCSVFFFSKFIYGKFFALLFF
jgi:hypothetical protein